MTEINIDEHTKGVLVFAKSKYPEKHNDWVVLIHHVEPYIDVTTGKKCLRIFRHIACDMEHGMHFFSTYKNNPGYWGNAEDYILYTPTEEQKEIIRNLLVAKKCKFIRAFNKVIPNNVI